MVDERKDFDSLRAAMKKILILDEYPSIREFLAEELSAEGYLVMPAGNPALTGKLLFDFHPDLVIMDIFINGKLQWDLVEAIRKENPALPVLIFTAECPPGDDHPPCGVSFVSKSPILDELKKRIQDKIGPLVEGRGVDRSSMNISANGRGDKEGPMKG